MSQHPRRDTGPELALRRILHAAGYRYRVNYPVPGLPRRTIDIAFTRRKVAVFVDGCFWHGCPTHGQVPASNRAWWTDKLEKNRTRDESTAVHLSESGWNVLRIWEHTPITEAFDAVTEALHNGASAFRPLTDRSDSTDLR
jgi:DNA mismatch endonuclease (patch repair protein)